MDARVEWSERRDPTARSSPQVVARPADPRLVLAQRLGGNRAAADALTRARGPSIQRCEKCLLVAQATGKPDPKFADIVEWLKSKEAAGGAKRQQTLAIANEWNQHHPETPVTKAHFGRFVPKDGELTAPSGGGTQAVVVDQAAIARLDEFERLLKPLAAAGMLDQQCKWQPEVAPGVEETLKEITFLRTHPELLTTTAVGHLAARLRKLADALGHRITTLHRLVLTQAQRLVHLGMHQSPSLPHAMKLFPGDDGAQLKGLVGEYLGRLAARERFERTGEVVYDQELFGVRLVEIIPRAECTDQIADVKGAYEKRSAPVLFMEGSNSHVGKIIGEVDTLLCRIGPGGFIVVGALESKGGNNDLDVVKAQTLKIAGNLLKIGANPATFCFADRVGNTYRNINAQFDLTSLAGLIAVYSTGPIRKQENRQFDISLGFATDEMECLLRYLFTTPISLWGAFPLAALELALVEPEQPPEDLVLAAADLPANVMDQYV